MKSKKTKQQVLPGIPETSKVKKTGKKKTQVSIKTQKYINEGTGEYEEFTVIQKNVNSDFNFHKIWLQDLLNILDSFGNKKIRILTFLLQEMRNSDNSVSVTYRYISEKTGISYPTVAATMKELVEANAITFERVGLYRFNPDLIVQGDSNKKQRLLIEYNYGDSEKQHMPMEEQEEKVKNIVRKIQSKKDSEPLTLNGTPSSQTDIEQWENSDKE